MRRVFCWEKVWQGSRRVLSSSDWDFCWGRAIRSCTFFPLIHHFTLQYHLSVPVKAGQELPCRMQVAHPHCGASLGISAHMLTLPFPAVSTDMVREWNSDCSFTVTSSPGVVNTHTQVLLLWTGGSGGGQSRTTGSSLWFERVAPIGCCQGEQDQNILAKV